MLPTDQIQFDLFVVGVDQYLLLSPIVFSDHIYLTCYSGYLVTGETQGSLDNLKRHLVCLERDDGTILWDRTVTAESLMPARSLLASKLCCDPTRFFTALRNAN